MERKIRIGAVSYLNTKPFIYGLENSPIKDEIALTLDYPANLVKLLKSGNIDIGLVPVGALPGLGEYHIISDYCIGTEGEVASVCLFSEVPIEEVEQIYLDFQSKTSVLLCKLLIERYWRKRVHYIDPTGDDYINRIKGKTAGLIIGDRALMNLSNFKFHYDLGLIWKEMTALPFVFAVWVSVKQSEERFTKLFNCATQYGIENIDKVIASLNHEGYSLEKYYMSNISYTLDKTKKSGMDLFLELIKSKI